MPELTTNFPGDERRSHLEQQLAADFAEIVTGLPFADIAVPLRGQGLPRVSRLARFALAPLVPLDNTWPKKSTDPAGQHYFRIPTDVEIHPQFIRGIFLDTRVAIALTYERTLCAIGGACIPDPLPAEPVPPDLIVTQLQGCSPRQRGGYKDPARNMGLHAGINWRATLVCAWARVGEHIGATTMGIVAASTHTLATTVGKRIIVEKNPYQPDDLRNAHEIGIRALQPRYDGVAVELGFSPMPDADAPRYWAHELPLTPPGLATTRPS